MNGEYLLKFYDVMTIRVSLYGFECWTLTKQQINRRETAEMCSLTVVMQYHLIIKNRMKT